MALYDTFVNSLADLPEGEATLFVRDLTPGRYKYCYRYVRALLSSDPHRYPDRLAIRFARGQLHPEAYSLQILEELPYIPAKYLA
ncbi:MAG: phenylphosphate carboxylase subunit gamma [Clostridia bacterium]|nr:phenylphosphate carboxylase subunit gamma [Clostridia bacterium]